jgi:hypothetical protein
MKKVLLAVALLVVVIGVSYFSALRSDSKGKKEFQDGYEKGAREAALYQKRADSLGQALEQDRKAHADTLKRLTSANAAVVDSLSSALESKDKEIASLNERKKGAGKTRTASAVRKPDTSRTTPNHAQILEYYRTRIKALPGDLSDYERKVAMTQIREETARRFSISMDDLNQIRQSGNVTE